MNALKKAEEEAPAEEPKPSNEEVLLAEIRDLLKKSLKICLALKSIHDF